MGVMKPQEVMRLAHDAAYNSHPASSRTDVATNVIGALYGAGVFDQTVLTAPGDAMQSAASRLAAAVRRVGADRALGYEDSMALREVESAVQEWTEARR